MKYAGPENGNTAEFLIEARKSKIKPKNEHENEEEDEQKTEREAQSRAKRSEENSAQISVIKWTS